MARGVLQKRILSRGETELTSREDQIDQQTRREFLDPLTLFLSKMKVSLIIHVFLVDSDGDAVMRDEVQEDDLDQEDFGDDSSCQ